MFRWRVCRAGTIASVMILSGEGDSVHAALKPAADDGLSLGTPTASFSDLCLASGAVIRFANADVVLTHSTNTLLMQGGEFNIIGNFAVNSTDFTVESGTGIVNSNGHYRVDGTQVVTNQQSAVADATAGNTTVTLNNLLARLRVHGLINT